MRRFIFITLGLALVGCTVIPPNSPTMHLNPKIYLYLKTKHLPPGAPAKWRIFRTSVRR